MTATLLDHKTDFPILQADKNGHPLCYLDTAASAQKPQVVIDAMMNVMQAQYANIHRGLYDLSQNTTTAYEAVRGKVANFIGIDNENEIIFTRNATESINLVAQSWGRTHLKEGDEVILSEMEHHANIVPWQLLRDQIGITIKVIPVMDDGSIDLETYKTLLSNKTKLVAVVHISNAIGTVNNTNKISEIAKSFNPEIKVLIDGSQAVVHQAVTVQDTGADFYIFTGHKLYGPTGIGVLWGKEEILEIMPPYQGGGDMIDRVSFEKTTYKAPPSRFEAGTPAIIEVIGLGVALDYLSDIGMDKVSAHEKTLFDCAMDELQAIDGLTYYGTAPDKGPIISLTAEWGHPSDLAMILNERHVAVRTGHHCCQPLMARYGIEATLRASFGLYNTMDDVDAFVSAMKKAKELLS